MTLRESEDIFLTCKTINIAIIYITLKLMWHLDTNPEGPDTESVGVKHLWYIDGKNTNVQAIAWMSSRTLPLPWFRLT